MKMIDLSEGFMALPSGFGTLEELFEVITALQLTQIAHPVAILNSNGYYNETHCHDSKRIAQREKFQDDYYRNRYF